MKKIALITFICTMFLSNSIAQITGANQVRKGNKYYEKEEFEKAAEYYTKSLEKGVGSMEGLFNLADAKYKQKQYQESAKIFKQLAEGLEDKKIKAKAYHNLGNSMMMLNDYKSSIDAYKNALRSNPGDDDTRHNLMMAMQKMKEQEQQQEQNQDEQDQDKKKDKKEQQKKQEQQDQEKKEQEQEKKEQEKKKQEQEQNQDQQQQQQQDQQQQEQDQQDQQDQKNQQNQQQRQQPQQGQMSKQEAQRMLDALQNQEKQTQKNLMKNKMKGKKKNIEKDW